VRTVELPDGRQLMYAVWGDARGTPVFSLHGTPGCRLNRYPDEQRLSAAGIRLITYDRPGYGRSDRHPGRQVVSCVADVEAIANALRLDRFAVTGGSGGGPHALAVAARLPERVMRARCAVGFAPYGASGLDWFAGMDPENVKEFGWALAGEEELHRQLTREAADMVARVAQDPANVLGADWELAESDHAVLANPLVQGVMREAVPETVARGVWGWVDDDLAFLRPWGFDLGEISVPVEIRYGMQDVLVPAQHGRWLGEHVPAASVVAETGGHLPDPDTLLNLLRSLTEAP
jgi:pimeloyl-ACP methyl ester carboxylesterase